MSNDVRMFRVHYRDEGPDGWWAEVEDLPGCFASGDTLEELEEALIEAISLYLSTPDRRVHVKSVDGKREDSLRERKYLVTA
jgi:predicted RNase H-like HicB family nuclease